MHREELPAYRVPEIWLMGHPDPNHAVDVTDVIDRKLAALRAHASQTGHMEDLEERVRGMAAASADRMRREASVRKAFGAPAVSICLLMISRIGAPVLVGAAQQAFGTQAQCRCIR